MEENTESKTSQVMNGIGSVLVIIMVIGIIACFPLAGYLSWNCNGALGYSGAEKIMYAIIATLFGIIYVMYYTLYRMDICSHCSHVPTPLPMPPQPPVPNSK